MRNSRAKSILPVCGLTALLGWETTSEAQQYAPPAPPTAAAAPAQPGQTYAAPIPAGQYSPTLGIYYELVPYYGAYAARLTQHPLPGSPLRQAQIQLEAGDMITHLDNIPIRDAGQLERHHSQTSVSFVNVRTNAPETRWAMLPPFGGGGGGGGVFPPPPPPQPMSLGVVAVPVTVNAGSAYTAGYAGAPAYPVATRALRITSVTMASAAAHAGLRPGDSILTAGSYAMSDVNSLRYAISQSGGVLPMTVQDAYGNTRNVTAYMGGAVPFGAAAAPAP